MELKQILVVDDSVIVRQLLGVYLMKYISCEISEAKDGLDAYSKITNDHFDLVITDIVMPRMDGLALIRKIRENIGPHLPIVVVSTKGSEKDLEAGLKLGANAYVTKPVRASALIQAITPLLTRT